MITGTITYAGQASPPQGQYAIRWQDITITDGTGQQFQGRIGSRNGYTTGTAIQVDASQKPDQNGQTRTMFKRITQQQPGNPYANSPQSTPQQSPQWQSPHGEKEQICFAQAVNLAYQAYKDGVGLVFKRSVAEFYDLLKNRKFAPWMDVPAETTAAAPEPETMEVPEDDIPF